MKILIHVCCAPCLIYPLKRLRESNHEVIGFFYNPNIHPYQEYKRRRDALENYADLVRLPVIYRDEYELEDFIRNVVFRERDRCKYCYFSRLRAAAQAAKQNNIPNFTSTLLYSRYQNHELIREMGENLAKEYKIKFYYEDFRKGWMEGIETSKKLNIYRQQYCGCIYSEKERYVKAGKIVPNANLPKPELTLVEPKPKKQKNSRAKKT